MNGVEKTTCEKVRKVGGCWCLLRSTASCELGYSVLCTLLSEWLNRRLPYSGSSQWRGQRTAAVMLMLLQSMFDAGTQ